MGRAPVVRPARPHAGLEQPLDVAPAVVSEDVDAAGDDEGGRQAAEILGEQRGDERVADQLGATATVVEKNVSGKRVLTLTAKGKSESWVKALVREGEIDTVIEVTPVMRLAEEEISGNGRPLVEFIIGRSADVQKALNTIDHAEQMRAK